MYLLLLNLRRTGGTGKVINYMDYHTIISLKLKGLSNQKVADIVGVSRETVRQRWKKYSREHHRLVTDQMSAEDFEKTKEVIIDPPSYDSSNRSSRKYNEQIDELLDQILLDEENKAKELTSRKQRLTCLQIHELIRKAGYDIGLTTITAKVREKRNRNRECFIAQTYEYGQRFEYDFGEVELFIGDVKQKVQMAVIACPASGYRWARLYDSQRMEVFLDSHVRFFHEVSGCFTEGVYDNMRNAVSHFTWTQKTVNEELMKLSIYYGFHVNLTNARSGNEKGTVEGSVKVIRNKAFAIRYKFDSFEEAQDYLQQVLAKMNVHSKIEEEKKVLKPIPAVPYETAQITSAKVNKYSFIRVDNNFYSVPESLIEKTVKVKKYPDHITVLYNQQIAADHQRMKGKNKTRLDIRHYLGTLNKKPGALRNSTVLKQEPVLEEFFKKYFTEKPKEFIEFIRQHQDVPFTELEQLYRKEVLMIGQGSEISIRTGTEISEVSSLFIGGEQS